MTNQQLKDFVRATLQAQRTISQEYEAFDAVIDFVTQSITTGIPSWTDELDFNTDGTGDGAFTTHLDSASNLRFWRSKVDDNIDHEPPTNPAINEDDFWIEVSPSSGSSIKEWAVGIYGAGLVIVYYNGELYLLTAGSRPYYSASIPTVDTANWKPIIKAVLGTSTWKQVAKVSTTAALPSYTALSLGGIENCLRATANGPFANVDGQVMNVGDTILVRHEDNWQLNKVYTLTTKGTTASPPFIPGSPWVLTPREDMRYSETGDLYINGVVKIELGTKHGGKIYNNKKDASTGSTSTWSEFPHMLRSYFQGSPTLVVGDVLKHNLAKVSSSADKPYAVIVQTHTGGLYYTPQASGLTETVPITGSPAVGDYIYVSPSGALTTTESDWIFGVYQSGGVLIDIHRKNQEHFKGEYASLGALQTAHPTATAGDYAIVNGGIGVDALKYIWDDDDAEWIIASGAPVPFASETVHGTVEEGTDAEVQNSGNTGTGGTGARLFVSIPKLWAWWTYVKTLAQTIAATWTFVGIKLSGQIESGKKVVAFIDTDGTITKLPWAEINTTTRTFKKTGVNNLAAGVLEEWYNSDDELIAQILNGKILKIGGSTMAIIVDDAIASGAAYLEMNSNQANAFFKTDKAGNMFEKYITTTGDIHKTLEQRQLDDQLSGAVPRSFIQRQATVAASSTTTTIANIPLPVNSTYANVITEWLLSEVGGDGGGVNIDATLRRNSGGTVAIVGAQDKRAGERRIAGSGTPDWACNIVADDTNKRINLNFSNNSATPVPKAFKVTINIYYTIILNPSE